MKPIKNANANGMYDRTTIVVFLIYFFLFILIFVVFAARVFIAFCSHGFLGATCPLLQDGIVL